MKKRIVYLSGKITGLPRWWVVLKFGFWRNVFWWAGYEVIDPTKEVPEKYSYYQALDMCINELLPRANCFYLMPGWTKSKGARIELRAVLKSNSKCRNRYIIIR